MAQGLGSHDVSLLGLLGSTLLTTVWTLVDTLGGLQWLQALVRSSVTLLRSAARYQGKHRWWPELLVFTHSVVAISCFCLCRGRGWLQIHILWWGPTPAVWANEELTGSCRDPGHQHGLQWLHTFLQHIAVDACDGGLCGGCAGTNLEGLGAGEHGSAGQ